MSAAESAAFLPLLRRAWRLAFADTIRLENFCRHRIGPVPKADNRVFVCIRPAGHRGEHADGDGAWWSQYEVDRTPALTGPSTTEES